MSGAPFYLESTMLKGETNQRLRAAWVFLRFNIYASDITTGAGRIGAGRAYDSSGTDTYLLNMRVGTVSLIRFSWDEQTSTGLVTSTSPFGWGDSDEIAGRAQYRTS